MILSLIRGEQISVLHMNYFPLKMELWVTNNFYTEAAALLWSKSFTVNLHVLENVSHFSQLFYSTRRKSGRLSRTKWLGQ
ncbi:unnamed protein product [Brassica oleracea]